MVDAPDKTLNESIHTTDEAHKRLKGRYGSEARFKLLGLLAVLTSAAFLLFLLTSIFLDALPAFQQHYLTLEIPLKAEEIDPDGTKTEDSLLKANYPGLIKKKVRSFFPGVKGRRDKRSLASLVSSNAGSRLQSHVLENPDLVGTNYTLDVLTSDFADLYFKGMLSSSKSIAHQGIASPVGTSGEVKVLSTSNDFSEILKQIKNNLRIKASELNEEIAGIDRSLNSMKRQITSLEARLDAADESQKKSIANAIEQLNLDIDSKLNQRKKLKDEVANFKQRYEAINQPEQLGTDIPSLLIKINEGVIKVTTVSATEIVGQAVLPLTSEKDAAKENWEMIEISPPEASRKLSDKEMVWLDWLKEKGYITKKWNSQFFTSGPSREAEVAGLWGAVVGTFYTMLVTMLLSFPIGVSAAIYLESFAPKNKITDFIEVNINNLAAVPSIVFGLLGLAVFLNFFGLPRSAPLVGGMVLALMTLPTIIIASRAALKAVPPSISEAALGLGASHMQAVFHHKLPLAMPGILTGSIIGMAQALGETAPLLMIGMVAFIVDIPGSTGFTNGFTDPATVLPVQIFMWADFPEVAFRQKTAAAIVALLAVLVTMNAVAVILRKKFERRW